MVHLDISLSSIINTPVRKVYWLLGGMNKFIYYFILLHTTLTYFVLFYNILCPLIVYLNKGERRMKPLKEKISITVDSQILIEIRRMAEEDDRSLSQYINLILKEHLQNKNPMICNDEQ